MRSLQLVHYAQNTLGDVQTLPPVYNGLSAFGRDVVRRMNRLGMVVDVAHASLSTVKATVDSTSGPIMLSHSHLQSDTSPHPRLITVEHARLVSSTGGLIGAWPSGFANRTFADFVDQTMRLLDAVVVDHVGLGTDMDGNFEPVFSNYRQLPDWVTGLRSKGLSETDLAKVVGGNAVRMLNQSCAEGMSLSERYGLLTSIDQLLLTYHKPPDAILAKRLDYSPLGPCAQPDHARVQR